VPRAAAPAITVTSPIWSGRGDQMQAAMPAGSSSGRLVAQRVQQRVAAREEVG
jgi:hypothetical protein